MIDSPQEQVYKSFQSLDVDISTDQSARAHCALGCSSALRLFLRILKHLRVLATGKGRPISTQVVVTVNRMDQSFMTPAKSIKIE